MAFERTPQPGNKELLFSGRNNWGTGWVKKGSFTNLPGSVLEQLGMVPALTREVAKSERAGHEAAKEVECEFVQQSPVVQQPIARKAPSQPPPKYKPQAVVMFDARGKKTIEALPAGLDGVQRYRITRQAQVREAQEEGSEALSREGLKAESDENSGLILPMQTKLRVRSPDDAAEKEDDAIADRVITMPLQRQVAKEENLEDVQRKANKDELQRQPLEEPADFYDEVVFRDSQNGQTIVLSGGKVTGQNGREVFYEGRKIRRSAPAISGGPPITTTALQESYIIKKNDILRIRYGLHADPDSSVADAARDAGMVRGAISARDAYLRLFHYAQGASRLANRAAHDYAEGRISHLQARDMASGGRNELLIWTRHSQSPTANWFSQQLKDIPTPLEDLQRRYVERAMRNNRQLRLRFDMEGLSPRSPAYEERLRRATLVLKDSPEISEAIMRAAGRTNRAVNIFSGVSGGLGAASAGLGGVSAAYEVINAPVGQKMDALGRETAGIAGGWVGGLAGEMTGLWIAGLVCAGATGGACVVGGLVITILFTAAGGLAGSYGARETYDAQMLNWLAEKAASSSVGQEWGRLEGSPIELLQGFGGGSLILGPDWQTFP